MTKISKIEIEKIAKLAKIHVTEKEQEKYSKDLSSILGYVKKLNKVKTDKMTETAQVTGLENIYADDKAIDVWKADKDVTKNREELLKNAPEKKDEYIKVKQMLQ